MTNSALRVLAATACLMSLPMVGTPRLLAQADVRQTVTIGMVLDGPPLRYADLADLIRTETLTLLRRDFEAEIPDEKILTGDWTVPGIRAALERLLADPEVSIIIAAGPIAGHVASTFGDLPKPLVAPFVVDRRLQDLPRAGDATGVRNFVYVSRPEPEDFGAFLEVTTFARPAILVSRPLAVAIDDLPGRARESLEALGLDPAIVTVDSTVGGTLEELAAGAFDAVYVLPLGHIPEDEFDRLVEGLIELGLPSFSWFGEREVQRGILTGTKPAGFGLQIARLTAFHVQRIVRGVPAGTLAVTYVPQDRISINMATARQIGVYPPWKILTEAVLVADEWRPTDRRLSFESAMREALAANRDVAAGERFVAAGAKNVRIATSDLLPQLNLSATAGVIDEDRAAGSLGTLAERRLTGAAELSQIIYSDRAWAARSIEESIQASREQNLETLRLDVAFEAAAAYLDVLRRKTVERIQRENLSLTRANLELARIRAQTGAASPGEVYRWENEIAVNRQAVIEAVAVRNIAEIELNRLLNRPLEETFATTEEELDDLGLRDGPQSLMGYMDNPWRFRVFREFMAQEALAASPELRSIDAEIEAQNRELTRASRSLWLPEFDLSATVWRFLAEDGAGADFEGVPGLPDETFAQVDDVLWSVALRGRYPLFNGTRRFAEIGRATESLANLNFERESLEQRVDQRLRASLHLLGASQANVGLSREAAAAAGRNYTLVRDSYSRGVASILDLLDAQNTSLVSDLDAVSVFYGYLIDLMRTQRAAGTFDYFASEADRDAFLQRLEDHFDRSELEGAAP